MRLLKFRPEVDLKVRAERELEFEADMDRITFRADALGLQFTAEVEGKCRADVELKFRVEVELKFRVEVWV